MTSTLPKRRPNGTLMPGTSLNPSGRPRVVQEIQELARSAAPAAFARVVALVDSLDERTALAASQEILNRAYGKPVMQVQSDVRKVDLTSLFALAAKRMAERAGADNRLNETALPIIDVEAEPVSSADEVQHEPSREENDPIEW